MPPYFTIGLPTTKLREKTKSWGTLLVINAQVAYPVTTAQAEAICNNLIASATADKTIVFLYDTVSIVGSGYSIARCTHETGQTTIDYAGKVTAPPEDLSGRPSAAEFAIYQTWHDHFLAAGDEQLAHEQTAQDTGLTVDEVIAIINKCVWWDMR